MTESAFATVNALVSEPYSTPEVLRIIARDAKGIASNDRAALHQAASELEAALLRIGTLTEQLATARQQLVEAQSRISELTVRAQEAPAPLLMRLGPLQISGVFKVGQ